MMKILSGPIGVVTVIGDGAVRKKGRQEVSNKERKKGKKGGRNGSKKEGWRKKGERMGKEVKDRRIDR
jgi:hypothetical protein